MDERRGRPPLPLWSALAPALTALVMVGQLSSDRDGPLPSWLEVSVLVVALALAALPFLQRLRRRWVGATGPG